MNASVIFDKKYTNIYEELKKTLNLKKPGFGPSDYGKFDIVDIPKAYAMILSAELMNYKRYNNDYNLSMGINAGEWLLNNKDLNNNGIVGWGVPVAWDAFGDNSINEVNTEYTITTGIVLNSLMDWMELLPNTAPKEKILATIKQAILPYLKADIFSSSGLFNYSLKMEDRKYNSFNASIYMAGQMQRFTKFTSNTNLKNKIKLSVDRVMSATLQYKKIDKKGGWYWSYSVEEDTIPNDLAHAGYTIDGIMTYINNGGTLKKLFESKAILKHLENFSDKNGDNWYFYPSFFGKNKLAPRLYGVGMTLYIYAKYIQDTEKLKNLLIYTQKYSLSNGLYSRWQKEDIVITEYLTYLMYGVSSYKFYKNTFESSHYLHTDKQHIEKFNNILKNNPLREEQQIPLTSLEDKNVKVLFNNETFTSKIQILNKTINIDKYKAIPIKLLNAEENYILIMRELISNRLILTKIDKKNNRITYESIDTEKNVFSDFREATIFNNDLALVVYESYKGQNTLLVLDIKNSFRKKLQLKLPSVEDPAGTTYEVIPNIILLPSSNQELYIISGRLVAVFNGKNIIQKKIKEDVKVFIEAIINEKREIYALYRNKTKQFSIVNLTTNTNYLTSKKNEIIFDINFYKNSIHYRELKSVNDLKELFLFDFLRNKGSGTLYLGTNNIEGWMAWAQVYYLNGMLSFLELAQSDIEFFNVMNEFLPKIKNRLDLEIKLLLNQKNSEDGLKCRVFSIDRSLATFAVQSSRFAMLLHRYLKLFPNETIEKEFQKLQEEVKNLNNHMEVLAQGNSKVVSKEWNPNNAYYLKWPKGNKFYFDGLPVPYNHQNEWATFILQTIEDPYYINIATSIIGLFIDNITKNKNHLPQNAVWPYWWAKAWDGWNKSDNISIHKKSYVGDKGDGWISFRTIDAISILALYNKNKNMLNPLRIKEIKDFVSNGHLYPFTSTYFLYANNLPRLEETTINNYIRFTSPWEFDNSIWSYFNFIKNRK